MKAYLKWLYGYKNFGDELLFLWVLERIFKNNPIEELVVEAGDPERLQRWLNQNYNPFLNPDWKKKIHIVGIQQHKSRKKTHIMNMLGRGKYKKYFKFFWGGEVLNEERPSPHDGRNLVLLYRHSLKHKNFALLWGLGPYKKKKTQRLYKYILPRAQTIVTREKYSYAVAQHILDKKGKSKKNLYLYQDFSLSVLQKAAHMLAKETEGEVLIDTMLKEENPEIGTREVDTTGKGYVLININSYIFNKKSMERIQDFCTTYSHCQKIYFPCDMTNDIKYFESIKKVVPNLVLFDRTKHSLIETLRLFYNAKSWLGARLHFLYPLKAYNRPLEALVYKEKIKKLIIQVD